MLNRATPSNRAGRQILSLIAVLVAMTLGLVDPAGAQSIEDVGDEVDRTGRFVEKDVDAELEGAIERANAADIGFVWLDQGGNDAEQIATTLASYLLDIGSEYRSIVVLNNDSVWVTSRGDNGSEAGQNARELFAIGDEAGGLDLVTDTITGAIDGNTTATTTGADTGSTNTGSDTESSSSSSGGFPWILLIVLGLLAFFGLRFIGGRRRARKQLEANMEADRLEIREQLKNNADRVIDLGDRVIAAGDPEMIRTYEKASATYQDVSQSIDAASTAEEVDRLDDRIDEAEWQFEVIEATLDGRPAPASPAELEPPPPPTADDRIAQPDQERPTVTRRGRTVPPLGDPGDIASRSSRTTTRTSQRRSSGGRSSGGGLGGMLAGGMGRMLMSVVASMLLGGLSRGGTSRRSQRRGGFGGGFGSSSGGIGGPGGGVLRRRR